jgi:hypothetical protein
MLDLQNLPPRLDSRGASEYLRVRYGIRHSVQTLAKKRCRGGGPRFYPGGGKPLYALSDLDNWAKDMLGEVVGSTSEYPKQQHAA